VASLLIPASYRSYIAAVYAFARTADDFADEEKNKGKILLWREKLHQCLKQKDDHPIFMALSDTIRKFDLPVEWLDSLLTAFLWDVEKNRFASLPELYQYSQFSANPIGRIILWIFRIRNEFCMTYSDYITTALQLTNFWQDISVDLKKNKIYIPLDQMHHFGVSEKQIISQKYDQNFEEMITYLTVITRNLFKLGKPLLEEISGRLRWELQLTIAGGESMLQKVYQKRKIILKHRPTLTKLDWVKIISRQLKKNK